ncbi:hypothetical protein ACFE04_020134 [Oxalis oulophora]
MTGAMEPYVKKLRNYDGDLPLVSHDYGASEGWIAVNVNPTVPPELATFAVLPDIGCFEFIPLSKTGEQKPVGLTEVKLGEESIHCFGYFEFIPLTDIGYFEFIPLLNISIRIKLPLFLYDKVFQIGSAFTCNGTEAATECQFEIDGQVMKTTQNAEINFNNGASRLSCRTIINSDSNSGLDIPRELGTRSSNLHSEIINNPMPNRPAYAEQTVYWSTLSSAISEFEDKEHDDRDEDLDFRAVENRFVKIDSFKGRPIMLLFSTVTEYRHKDIAMWFQAHFLRGIERDARTRVKRLAEFIGYPRRWSRKGSRDNQELYLKTIKQ